MTCENEFCVHNRELKCILGEVYINSQATCDDYTPISLDPEIIKTAKERHLREKLHPNLP